MIRRCGDVKQAFKPQAFDGDLFPVKVCNTSMAVAKTRPYGDVIVWTMDLSVAMYAVGSIKPVNGLISRFVLVGRIV